MARPYDDSLFYGLAPIITDEQKIYVDAICDYDVVMCNAVAGTGKSYVALATAKYLMDTNPKKYEKVIYVFAPVQEGEMGFRPGTQLEKETAYYKPLVPILRKMKMRVEDSLILDDGAGMKFGRGWLQPTSHLFDRGVTYSNSILIIDEAQNFTDHQLKKEFTRVDISTCKLIVTGHTGQCDLKDPYSSGFEPYMYLFHDDVRVAQVQLTQNFRGWFAQKADTLPMRRNVG